MFPSPVEVSLSNTMVVHSFDSGYLALRKTQYIYIYQIVTCWFIHTTWTQNGPMIGDHKGLHFGSNIQNGPLYRPLVFRAEGHR